MSIGKKLFMAGKVIQDLRRGANFYPISSDVKSEKLGEYYLVFDETGIRSGKFQSLIADFDQYGIPLNKTYIDVSSDKLVYYPITIGQVGLSVYHTYLKTKKSEDLSRFFAFADWYMENADVSEKLGARWLTNVPLPAYNNPGPWQSAFSQSRAISILLRAYQESGNFEYKEMAERGLKPFDLEVKGGGVMSMTPWGPFYEEYTSEYPVLVLNGHIFSLFGLKDFLRSFPENKNCEKLFNQGINSLINCLDDYDLGYWTKYNNCKAPGYPNPDPSTISYQRLHVMLLQTVDRINPNPIFKEVAERWNRQINLWNYLRSGILKYQALKKLNRI